MKDKIVFTEHIYGDATDALFAHGDGVISGLVSTLEQGGDALWDEIDTELADSPALLEKMNGTPVNELMKYMNVDRKGIRLDLGGTRIEDGVIAFAVPCVFYLKNCLDGLGLQTKGVA